ncbi:hypothetical protein DFJ63DRAFT_315928 [Scheffersomyces coipomensis]|uniref:uncharacterized protein n=1 Tax=Scheffersomyces coipomensis TaxID=1788519 RepID=UPI00315DF1C4
MNSERQNTGPRHAYNASASSVGSSFNAQIFNSTKANRSSSSGVRMGPTTNSAEAFINTNVGGNIANETQSLRTIDRIPSARPSVTYSDKLWTQIDVLDDVKAMAEEVRQKGSFFNSKFEEELNNLKSSQNNLLKTMSTQHFDDLKTKEAQKTLMKSQSSQRTVASNELDYESNKVKGKEAGISRQEKLNEFFDDDEKEKHTRELFNRKQNLDEMNKYIAQIKDDLKAVATSMKKFDETTKEQW